MTLTGSADYMTWFGGSREWSVKLENNRYRAESKWKFTLVIEREDADSTGFVGRRHLVLSAAVIEHHNVNVDGTFKITTHDRYGDAYNDPRTSRTPDRWPLDATQWTLTPNFD